MRPNRFATVASLVLATSLAVGAQPGRPLRLASLAPARSVWDNDLQQMRSDWERTTQGRVRAVVYPSGQQGDEGAVLLKLQSGTLNSASLMLTGLSHIDPAFNVLGVPLFFESYEELNHVIARLTPMLRARLEAKGYVLLHWGHAGWVRVFSTRPVSTLADLKSLKLYTTAGDDQMVRLYQRRGFRPIALASTAILTGLTSGMIDAVPTTPSAMLFLQWYSRAKYMLDVPLAPFVGATVITSRTWATIDAPDRTAMLAAAGAAEARLARTIPKQDTESIAVMRQKGLTVLSIKGPEWTAEAQHFAEEMKAMVPDEVFAAARDARDEYRKRGGVSQAASRD